MAESFQDLLNKSKKRLNINQIKHNLLLKISNKTNRYSYYQFFFPFGQHLRKDYPTFIPFYENLQHNNQNNIFDDNLFVSNLMNEMEQQYNKNDTRLYDVIMIFFEKY
jgi:hypothetical protein